MSSTEHETTSTHNHRGIRGFFAWLGTIISIVVLGVASYGVYLVRAYVPIVGYIWLITVSLIPAIGICFLVVALLKFALKAEIIELGTQGNLLRVFGRVTEYYPLGLKEHRTHVTKEQESKDSIKVPELLTVLRDGLLNGVELLLGYHTDGTPRFGVWDDLRTFVVAGKSRSGKTVTMVFFIVQALLAHAVVYVCDPHYNKKTGLLKVIEPLLPFLNVARTDTEILQAVTEFLNEMRSRVSGTSENIGVPMLLVIDEWSKLLRDLDNVEIELLVNTVLGCAEEYAGFDGYAMIAGHEWTARESGGKKGAAIRRAFHSVFVHRLDEDYAKFLLTGKNKRMAKNAPNLPTGNAYFQDSEGEPDYLIIPYYGKQKEGIHEVVEMLRAIAAPSYAPDAITTPQPKLLDTPSYIPTVIPQPQNGNGDIDEDNIQLNTDEDKVRFIQRLRKRNIAHRDIAYMFGWYGANYHLYKAFCERNHILIETTPETVKQ